MEVAADIDEWRNTLGGDAEPKVIVRRRTRLTNLSQALHLLRNGAVPEARPDDGVLKPLDAAIGSLLGTLRAAHLAPASTPVSLPTLDALRDGGIPTVDENSYQASAQSGEQRRALLAAFLRDDGWPIGEGGRG